MKMLKRKSNLSEEVFEELKDQIISGKWAPGSKIPSEHKLTEILGVSRITVREALQRLTILGLIETRHGEGTFVKKLSPDMHISSLIPAFFIGDKDVIDVIEFRKMIETGAVALAVQNADEDDIKNMRSKWNEMKKSTGDYKKYAVADSDFHLAIAEASKNPLVIKVEYLIKDILSVTVDDLITSLGGPNSLQKHKEVIDAIENKDVDTAKKIIESLTNRTIEFIKSDKKKNKEK